MIDSQLIRVSVMTAQLTGSAGNAIDDGRRRFASFLKIILYIFVIALIIVISVSLIRPKLAPQYWAETLIVIDAADSSSAHGEKLGEQAVTTQLQLLRSSDLARTVIQSLGLDRHPAFVSALDGDTIVSTVLSGIGLTRDAAGISLEERLLEIFAANLSVTADDVRISVGFTSSDAEVAADVANAVAAEYIALQQAASRRPSKEEAGRLAAEIDALRRRVEALDARAEVYRRGIDRLSRSEPSMSNVQRQERAEAQLRSNLRELEDEAAGQRSLLESRIQRYREMPVRRQNGFPPLDVRVLSPAVEPVEPAFAQKASITAVVGVLAIVIMVVFVVARRLARNHHRRRFDRFQLPKVVETWPTRARARRRDDRSLPLTMYEVPANTDYDVGRIGDDVVVAAGALVREGARRIMVVTLGGEVDQLQPLVAVALARAIAAADRRPVLIDLRDDGAIGRAMSEGGGASGFSDLFGGEVTFGQVICRDHRSRAHFIANGLRPLSRQELADERIGLLVSALEDTYDHVVFDVPGDFAEVMGRRCDAAVVATAYGRYDPRTVSLVERIRACSPEKIIFVGLDTVKPSALVGALCGAAA
jgi:uncharacterized protein involved in exopolysaccharide biosynthesis